MSETVTQLLLTPMSQVESRRQEFLDSGSLIPLGAPTIFAGRGSVGKSTLALDYAAKVSNGTLEGRYFGQPRTVLLIQHEDDPATQVKPRLIAAGANLDNVITMVIRVKTEGIESYSVPYLTEDMPLIKEALEETNAALVIIDPLTSSVGGDLHKVHDVRRALDPLSALCQEHEIAAICLMHVRKGHAATSDKMSGSHAFRDVTRSLLVFAHDEESGQRVVTVDKSNYADVQGLSFAFNLISMDIPTDDGNITSVARVEHLGVSEVSVTQIWNRETEGEGEEESSDAKAWLKNYLKERGGRAAAKDIMRDSLSDGFSKSTIQRAGRKICDKASGEYQGSWYWTLKDVTDTPQGSQGSQESFPENYENNVRTMERICSVCLTPSHEVNALTNYVHPTCLTEVTHAQ